MKVLVIGAGGREHSLIWKIKQSKINPIIYALGANGGISEIAHCVDIELQDFPKISDFVKTEKIDFTVVGPEAPLVEGIGDYFTEKGLKIYAPNKKSSQLEGSKVFAKNFMQKYGIPTADFEVFDDFDKALKYAKQKENCVIKVDGLAAGKGTFVCHSLKEIEESIKLILKDKIFGSAGKKIVIEDLLKGEEVSLMGLCDGNRIIPLIPSQDHKRIGEKDTGPNTGGMGAYAPCSIIDEKNYKIVEQQIFSKLLNGFKNEEINFKGTIYVGIIVTEKGPYVLEFNVRFGDPETQAVLPLLKTDFLDVLIQVSQGNISKINLDWEDGYCACVVIASGGYPQKYEKGKLISGLDKPLPEGVIIFHAGTLKKDAQFFTNGGRVLGVTAKDKSLKQALNKIYTTIENIYFENMYYRKDIGWREIKRIYGT